MHYTYQIEIDAPLARVAELMGDPSNRIHWMDGIEGYEHLNGQPGQEGSTSKMIFNVGGREIVMTGTVVENNLPDSFTESIDASNATITAVTTFRAISPDRTEYTSEQTFDFKGVLNKIIGFLIQKEFKKQTLAHMEGFKRFVESSH